MSFLYYIVGSSSDTYVPLLMRHLHGSFTQVGLSGTIAAVAEIPLMILVGSLADRGGRAQLLAIGMIAVPLRFALYAVVHTPLQLMGVQALDGVSFSVYAIAGVALLTELIPPEERAWALGIYAAAGTVGPIVGPVLSGLLATSVGLQPMFGLLAIGACVVPLAVAVGLWPSLWRASRAGSSLPAE
jgi:MFS family permease